MAISLTCQSCGLESLQRLILPLALLLLQCRAKCPKFVHLSSLLNLSGHTHVKIVLLAGCVDKTYQCGTKKTRNYEKMLRTTREESIFHFGNQA